MALNIFKKFKISKVFYMFDLSLRKRKILLMITGSVIFLSVAVVLYFRTVKGKEEIIKVAMHPLRIQKYLDMDIDIDSL